jgi:hypothetical protein
VLPIWNSDFDICAKIVLRKGKLVQLYGLNLDINREIQELEQRESCTYLGVEESIGVQHQQMKD